MGPTTYSLCQKPILGLVMWISSLCGFPPLFSDEPIDLTTAEATATRAFKAPVEKSYPLAVTFEFSSVEARLSDQVVGGYNANCEGKIPYDEIPELDRKELGHPIPFRVVVRKAKDRSVLIDKTFVSLCRTSHNGKNAATRIIGWLALPIGDYIAEVTNLQAQTALVGVRTTISLYGGQGK